MKKIYSFALAAVAILSAASCQKEMANAPEVENGEKFTVVATAAETKTVLEGNVAYWMPGDKITIFDATGAPVVFTTNITEKAAKAEFTAESFNAPDSLVAVYNPTRAATLTDGKIYPLRAGGDQKPVAGSFDPNAAIAVGGSKAAGSNELVFNNIHSLVKFTVGDVVPSSVKVVNNGGAILVGLLYWNVEAAAIEHSGAGESSVTVSGTYEKGQTYYIAVTPNEAKGGLSVYFDDVLVKNTGADITLLPNTIYNLGTLPAPAEEPEQPADIWAGENVVSYDLPESASSKRQVLRNIKYVADAENLYIKLQASASLFTSNNAAYLGLMIFDTVSGSTGSGYWGWWNNAMGNTEFNAEHAGVFTGTDLVVKVGETEVVAVTETSGDDIVWTMAIPRSAHAVLAGAKAYMGVLVMETFEPCGAMPDKYEDMLEVVLP